MYLMSGQQIWGRRLIFWKVESRRHLDPPIDANVHAGHHGQPGTILSGRHPIVIFLWWHVIINRCALFRRMLAVWVSLASSQDRYCRIARLWLDRRHHRRRQHRRRCRNVRRGRDGAVAILSHDWFGWKSGLHLAGNTEVVRRAVAWLVGRLHDDGSDAVHRFQAGSLWYVIVLDRGSIVALMIGAQIGPLVVWRRRRDLWEPDVLQVLLVLDAVIVADITAKRQRLILCRVFLVDIWLTVVVLVDVVVKVFAFGNGSGGMKLTLERLDGWNRFVLVLSGSIGGRGSHHALLDGA